MMPKQRNIPKKARWNVYVSGFLTLRPLCRGARSQTNEQKTVVSDKKRPDVGSGKFWMRGGDTWIDTS